MKTKQLQLPSESDATGRGFGEEELNLLKQVLESGTLNCTKGTMVNKFEEEFASLCGAKFCTAVTSGTAAIHTAIAAIDPEPGDEIITTSVTDMGAISPIIYQTAIPIFADIDPHTYNITASTIGKKITKRTKAIIVTHLFGNPCSMDPILELANKFGIYVIEDSCQAYLSTYKQRRVGTIGHIGCFSLQQTKHITTGEGGMVVTNDPNLARRIKLFHDKAWGYGDSKPDHYFLAINYRMTELQGAIARAQLKKLPEIVEKRKESAAKLTKLLLPIKGIETPLITENSTHVYWKYVLRINNDIVGKDVSEIAKLLKEQYGIFSAPRYIQKPAFECEVLKSAKTFGNSGFPLRNNPFRKDNPTVTYSKEDYPNTYDALSHMLVLPWNEFYTDEHVEFIASAIKEVIHP